MPRALSLLLPFLAVALDAQEPLAKLDDARFEAVLRELTPDPTAPWRSVPWRIDLLQAQREAAAANSPLFVWAMDGHPLGCT